MERPWLLLCRVLHVDAPGDDDDLQADAEEHGLDVDAEAEADAQAQNAEDHVEAADAQAQEAQNAGVGDAEDHVEAADAQAQDAQNAGVGEAEDHVEAADAQAQEAQNAGVEEAEHHVEAADAQAQAQEAQNAGVEEAEDHVEAADAAAEAQAQNAAVAEAEEGAQEHGAGGEAQGEEDEDAAEHDVAAEDAAAEAQNLLEESIIDVNTNILVAQWAHAMMRALGAGESDFTITVAPPPLVSSLITGPRAHPDPERPDMFPYIVATGRFCLLVHFAIAPFYGTNFGWAPNHSHLVVVRHFLRDDDGVLAACADRIPDRPYDDFVNMPAVSNIKSVGLVCDQETGHILIAELIVAMGAPEAALVYIGEETGGWKADFCVNPLLTVDNRRDWVPHGTVTINSTVLWYDLSWGMISCDLAQPPLQVLNFHRLPPGRVLRAGAGAGVPDLDCRRCIAVSENLVRYVEIILSPHDEAATVNMWYRDVEGNPPWLWQTNYSVSFEDIWGHDSYQQTGLLRTTPMLVGVSPVDSNVIYFSLNQRLFGVNVPEHTVVDCEQYQPLNRPGPNDEPVTSRYFISWNLGADGAINVGHQPDDPSDHGDSSPGGPADEGDIDYQTPPE